jgi:phage terminase small subunit
MKDLKKLSPRERILIKEKAKGKSTKDAMIKAGYAERTAHGTGSRKIKELQPAIQALMEKRGLTDDYLLAKLEEELNAEETKFFQHEGIVCDERTVVAHGSRLDALDKAFKLKGSYAPTKGELSGLGGAPLLFQVVYDEKPLPDEGNAD